MNTESSAIKISDRISLGGDNPLFLVGGPCVIESEEHTLRMAERIQKVCEDLAVPFIFKASLDKANRSSLHSYRGPGLEKGLAILKKVKAVTGLPVLSDIHEASQIEAAAAVLDIIQIPAFLCRQTDLLIQTAQTGKPINIKKGQFMAPWDMANILEKIQSTGNKSILLTERGTSFGYNNLIFDPRSIPIMKQWGFPVIIDAGHSVQKPGGLGKTSGGESQFIPYIARAGISVGADGLFIEIHDNPEKALADGPNSLLIKDLRGLLSTLLSIRTAVGEES
jgi:2-dehydro-3-deoxyphosphooctonate aldolase (KDO 8-P synthase)